MSEVINLDPPGVPRTSAQEAALFRGTYAVVSASPLAFASLANGQTFATITPALAADSRTINAALAASTDLPTFCAALANDLNTIGGNTTAYNWTATASTVVGTAKAPGDSFNKIPTGTALVGGVGSIATLGINSGVDTDTAVGTERANGSRPAKTVADFAFAATNAIVIDSSTTIGSVSLSSSKKYTLTIQAATDAAGANMTLKFNGADTGAKEFYGVKNNTVTGGVLTSIFFGSVPSGANGIYKIDIGPRVSGMCSVNTSGISGTVLDSTPLFTVGSTATAFTSISIITNNPITGRILLVEETVGSMGGVVDTSYVPIYYVDSASGSDSSAGTSPSMPLKTISAANLKAVDGSRILLKSGSKFRCGTLNQQFISTKIVHVGTYGGSERPIIDGSLALSNAGFAVVPGYANVYSITVSYASLYGAAITVEPNNASVQLFEGATGTDGSSRLKCANGYFSATFSWTNYARDHAANLAYVRDNPGTYSVSSVGGTALAFPLTAGADQFVFYVHLADNGNPISNGKEYSVSSPSPYIWQQLFGGSISDIRFSRWGFSNTGRFEGCKIDRCLWDDYHRHGPFFNACAATDCDSYGVFSSGTCYHGYRETSTIGTGGKNTMVRCTAHTGQWGYYSHGSGVTAPQTSWELIDCRAINVEKPCLFETLYRSKVTRLIALDITTAVSADDTDYVDCIFRIKKTTHPDYPSPNGVFFMASKAKLVNCIISGGSALYTVGARYLWHNTIDSDIVLEKTTIATETIGTLNSTGNPTGKISLLDSVWPADGTDVLSATNSYYTGVAPAMAAPTYEYGSHRILRLKLTSEQAIAGIGSDL